METPPSRVLQCFQEGAENPKSAACQAAKAIGGSQQFYDWNGVNQGSANGNHRAVVPDGQLCSGGNSHFKGLDVARGDWPAATLVPDRNGNYEFSYVGTAPHATKSFEFYVTRDGYDPAKPLKWSDLESSPFCTTGNLPLQNGRYKMTCQLPKKTGKHVIYNIWQRSDSQEAFYACIDVNLKGGNVVSSWKEVGPVSAKQALTPQSKVTLRVFDKTDPNAYRDLESHSVTLVAGQTAAADWPYYLAGKVNVSSSLVQMGAIDANGNVQAARGADANKVFRRADAGDKIGFNVDIAVAPVPVDPPKPVEPPKPPADNGGSTGGVTTQYTYPQGLGGYVAGTAVKGTDGKAYACKPWPYTGWCNGSSMYYAPGTGLAWKEAWDLK
ncbi:lytic polysaccharide monooxygenase [Crenobacter cavernae]|uniref:Chitin-binding protein n=1 Tax=Crenobacter cavernae TaxID=2290923 RepID=A0A345Y8X6_9NEIS|nr:lytic polysaccharide monooxygenase [Crenobacter cavernae]AXK40378.1 chitin-binding protein [Crenobacter cavernae]